MKLTYRQCTLDDLEQIMLLGTLTFLETYGSHNKVKHTRAYIAKAFSKQQIKAELSNPNSQFYLYFYKNTAIGYLKVNENDAQTNYQDKNSLEIERIYLYIKYQHKGIGKQMLRLAKGIATMKRKDSIWLGVWEKNEKAISFYESNGFNKIATQKFLYGKAKQTDFVLEYKIRHWKKK